MKKTLSLLAALICIIGCISKGGPSDEFLSADLDFIPVEYDEEYIYLDVSTGKKASNSKYYEDVDYFYNGFAVVKKDGSLSLINKEFQAINKNPLSQATIFREGLAYVVEPGEHIKAMNKSGEYVFTLDEAATAYFFNDGVSVFETEDGDHGLVDRSGKILFTSGEYIEMMPFGVDGTICAAKETNNGEKWGVIDYHGNELIPFEYSDLIQMSIMNMSVFNIEKGKGLFLFSRKGDKYGVIDTNEEEILPPSYSAIYQQPDGSFLFAKMDSSSEETRVGWMNDKGEEIISPLFSGAAPFIYSQLTVVKDPIDDKYGIIDKMGHWIVLPEFQYASGFNDDRLAIVRDDSDKFGLVNEGGEYVVNAEYDDLIALGKGLYIVKEDDTQGIINSKGEFVIKMSDLYTFYPPDMVLSNDNLSVYSEYINVNSVVDRMMEDIYLLKTDTPSKEHYENTFGVDLDGYGWEDLSYDYCNYYSVSLSAFTDYDYGYSYYDGAYVDYYLTFLKVDFDLSGKIDDTAYLIYNELAKRLGVSATMDKSGDITGNTTFIPSFLENCHAELNQDFEILITPDSGKFSE